MGGGGEGWGNTHFFLGGTHFALQQFLKTGNFLEGLASVIEHVLGERECVGKGGGRM